MTHEPDHRDDGYEDADEAPLDPASIPAPESYHWTPRLERAFLESLAATGSVKLACRVVGMSTRAAYDRRKAADGAALRLGWAAAVLIARDRLADELLDRAIWGIEEEYERVRSEQEGLNRHSRRRHDSRLGLAMLARLDRMADTRAKEGEAMLAQIVAGDWAGFLALFDLDLPRVAGEGGEGEGGEAGGGDAARGRATALACWLAGRDNRANPLAALWRGTPIAREVARSSADPEPAPAPDPTPEEEAAAMAVWYDEEAEEWRTDFPPPEDFAGIEEGAFGDEGYERTLEPEEEAAMDAACQAAVAPLRKAGEAARHAFFGFPTPANDPGGEGTQGKEKGSHEDTKPQRAGADPHRQAP
ncbi:MAG TPA: hypothetical protein PKD48_15710 [Sphingopyxis sp.]|nr:hypothetical protein [Sphingopyxis sp.]